MVQFRENLVEKVVPLGSIRIQMVSNPFQHVVSVEVLHSSGYSGSHGLFLLVLLLFSSVGQIVSFSETVSPFSSTSRQNSWTGKFLPLMLREIAFEVCNVHSPNIIAPILVFIRKISGLNT